MPPAPSRPEISKGPTRVPATRVIARQTSMRRASPPRYHLAMLTVRAIRAVPVEVPMKRPLGTSAAAVPNAPLLLVDLQTEEGVIGRSCLFCYLRAAAPGIAEMLGEI